MHKDIVEETKLASTDQDFSVPTPMIARNPVAGPHPTPAAQPLPLIIPTWSFERYTRTFVIYHGVNDQNF